MEVVFIGKINRSLAQVALRKKKEKNSDAHVVFYITNQK